VRPELLEPGVGALPDGAQAEPGRKRPWAGGGIFPTLYPLALIQGDPSVSGGNHGRRVLIRKLARQHFLVVQADRPIDPRSAPVELLWP